MNYRTYNEKDYEGVVSARISDDKQAESGLSIPAQLTRITEYTSKLGFSKPKIFSYIESSTKDRRIKFDELLEYIDKSKKKVVLVIDTIDRLQRSFRESVILERYWKSGKLEIHFYREGLVIHRDCNSADLLRWDMGVMFARSYVLQLSDNVKRARDQKLRNGEYPGKAPFGYKNTTLENGKKWIVPHEFNSIVVKTLYEWYATGTYSMLAITLKANKQFELNLSKGHIDYILKRKFYYGEMECNKGKDTLIVPHNYEKIIPRELYDKVQEVKLSYHKKPFKYAGKFHIYGGMIKCHVCNLAITAEPHKGTDYYHCTNYQKVHDTKCGHKPEWLPEHELTSQFAELFKSIQMPKDVLLDVLATLKSSHQGKIEYYNTYSAQLNAEHTKYERRIEEMYEDKLDGTISSEFYDKKRKEYREKQRSITQQLEKLDRVDETYYYTASTLLELANRAYDLFLSSEPEEKRQLLSFVLSNCTLEGRLLRYNLLKPFDTMAKCAKRQTWLPREDSNL